jgi:hypothetical protein
LDNNPKRRRIDKGATVNARFNRMIETMHSHIPPTGGIPKMHKKRRGQSLNQINDAYSPPSPVHKFKNRLSFIKMAEPKSSALLNDDRSSSDSFEANIEHLSY